MASMPANSVSRWGFTGLGFVLLGVGLAGLVLPVLPGTIFLILSLACFARGNERMESWMLEHPKMGPPLRTWRDTGAMSVKAKTISTSCMVLFGGYSLFRNGEWWVTALMLALVVFGISYVLTRPTLKPQNSVL